MHLKFTGRVERWQLIAEKTEETSQIITQYLIFLVKRRVTMCTLAILKQHYMWTAQISKIPEVWLSWAMLQV